MDIEQVNAVARELEGQSHAVLVNCTTGYWGRGKSLPEAIGKCYDAGARGTQVVYIDLFIGPEAALKECVVANALCVEYPQSCARIRIGHGSVKMRKHETL